MPINRTDNKIAAEKARLSREIADLAIYLSYKDKMAICLASGVHEDTFDRYKEEVKKIPTAQKILAEAKKLIADRAVQSA